MQIYFVLNLSKKNMFGLAIIVNIATSTKKQNMFTGTGRSVRTKMKIFCYLVSSV